jgi:hypothetical protein
MAGELIVKNGLVISGSTLVSGSVTATTFIGAFSGTITDAVSASYALTSSYINPLTQSVFISGSTNINGLLTINGNIIPAVSKSFSLGSSAFPFRDVFISSGSLVISSDNPGSPSTTISNVDGNILISAGGMQLVGSGSFNANTGSFQYISGSLTQVGTVTRIGNTVQTGSFNVSGSTNTIGTTTLSGSVFVSGSVSITNDANLITHNIKALGSNGLQILANNGAIIATMGQGGGSQANFTGSLSSTQFTSPSITGSLFGTSSWANNAQTASYVNTLNQNVIISGSVFVSGSVSITNDANLITHTVKALGSNGLQILANNGAVIATMGQGGGSQANFTGSLSSTQFTSPSITGSLFGTSSWSSNAITASYIVTAQTASYVLNAVSSSFASTASLAPLYVLTSATSSMLAPYLQLANTSSMLSSYLLTSRTSSFATTGSNTFKDNQVVTGSITSTAEITAAGNITAQINLKSMYQSGDEGGEIFLNAPATNTTIPNGVTIDVYQNRLRIFEQGGGANGYYLEMPSGSAGVGTNLKPAGFTGTVTIFGNPPPNNLNFTDGILTSVT